MNLFPVKFKMTAYLAGVLILTAIVYSPVLKSQFTNWDDDKHLLRNKSVRSLDARHLKDIFTSTPNETYVPLSILSFALEFKFFKYNPFIYHLDNLLLHLLNLIFIFCFVRQIGVGKKAAFWGVLLFGIHPIHVEAVAWVTARKDVLYTLFYLLSLMTYIHFIKTSQKRFFILSLASGLLSMLSKPMALSLPLSLLLCDWLLKRKINREIILEKLFFLVYVLPLAWVTYVLNTRILSMHHDIWQRGLIASWSLMFNIRQFFWPSGFYPGYLLDFPVSIFHYPYLSSVLLSILLVLLLVRFRTNRLFIFAVFFYLGNIFYLVRFDQIPFLNIVADRFMYLPSLGFCLWAGQGIDEAVQQTRQLKVVFRASIYVLIIAGFLSLGIKSFNQCQNWENSLTLWNHLLSRYHQVDIAFNNRGQFYSEAGREDLALINFNQAILINPTYAHAYNNRGYVYYIREEYQKAFADFNQAIYFDHKLVAAYNNRGNAFYSLGQLDLALKDFDKAFEIEPDNQEVYNNKAILYKDVNQFETSLWMYNKALEIDPYYAKGYYNRGNLYKLLNDYNLALADYNKAISLSPKFIDAYINRGELYMRQEQYQWALGDFSKALEINPNVYLAYLNRGTIYKILKKSDMALSDYNKAIELQPNNALGYNHRGSLFVEFNQSDLAVDDFNRALTLDSNLIVGYLNRAIVYSAEGEYDLASKDFDHILELNPEDADVFYNRGNMYLKKEKLDSAIADFTRAIELDPQHSGAYANRSAAYREKKEYQKALADLLKAQSLGVNVEPSYMYQLLKVKKVPGTY